MELYVDRHSCSFEVKPIGMDCLRKARHSPCDLHTNVHLAWGSLALNSVSVNDSVRAAFHLTQGPKLSTSVLNLMKRCRSCSFPVPVDPSLIHTTAFEAIGTTKSVLFSMSLKTLFASGFKALAPFSSSKLLGATTRAVNHCLCFVNHLLSLILM